jgi:hypothetical protein
MQNDIDDDDCLDTCTYCGEKYDPECEGHTEIDMNEEETGNYFCSSDCEMHYYQETGKPFPKQPC